MPHPANEDFESFLELVLLHGFEHYRKFYSVYRGEVVRVDDPEKRGRIQAHVPAALQTEAPDVWIDPSFEGAGTDRGCFWPPEIGDSVQVMFENGDGRRPCLYLGGWFGAPASRNERTEIPAELGYVGGAGATPSRRGFVTRMGHTLVFDDTAGGEALRLVWHRAADKDAARTDPSLTADRTSGDIASLEFTSASVVLRDAKGSQVVLDTATGSIRIEDAHGNKIVLDKQGLRLKSPRVVHVDAPQVTLTEKAGSPAILGDLFYRWASTHTHPTPMGPSGPPSLPPPAAALSKKVRLS